MTAGPDYELAYAMLADERDGRVVDPHPASVWRQAMLELAARSLGFNPATGIKVTTRSFLGMTPPPALTLEEVNEILGRVGIQPLVLRTLTAEEMAARWVDHNPFSDVMEAFLGATG